jgi:hypothetical protein
MEPYSGSRGGTWGTGLYGGEFGGGHHGGRQYGREYGRRRGDYPTYGPSGGEWYGREGMREWGREPGHAGGEDRGPLERFGDRIKEGMRKLTGRAPKGYHRSDERIRDDVCEHVARSWVNAEDVEIKVERGEVTLTGFVERRDDKRAIEDLAEDVFGVDEVHNQIRLRREPRMPGPTPGAGTGTTGGGVAMSAQQQTRPGTSQQQQQQQPGYSGRH